jgi:hypothetical protein
MKRAIMAITLLGLALGINNLAIAGNTTMQQVRFRVLAINEIAVNGNPQEFVVGIASSGSQSKEAADSSSTYAITTNGKKKITGRLDGPMPNGTALRISLGAPKGGTTAGDVALTASDADLVMGINKVAASNLNITYKFYALPRGDEVSGARTVILTLVNGD